MTLKLIGVGASPFVRKVRVTLAEKGLSYDHDPMMPFGVSAEYKRMHPLGKIPTLVVDGDRAIPDSSAICAYLEAIQPEPSLYPSDPYEHARALWLEEFGDGGVSNGTGPVFQERVLARMFKRPADEAKVKTALEQTLPPLLDYLEATLGDADWLVADRFSIADIAVGSQFVNFAHGGGEVDAKRWPKVAAWLQRVHGRPSFKSLIEEEKKAFAGA